jgi:MoaA/NifB/PqqE/SkfB family radical SAM enzyme
MLTQDAPTNHPIKKKPLKVVDPGMRLPKGISFPGTAYGVLFVPPSVKVAIHPNTVKRILDEGLCSQKPIVFTPEIPASSQLGLPGPGPVLYWLPELQPLTLKEQWKHIRKGVFSMEARVKRYLKEHAVQPYTITPIDEQEHYFIDQFHTYSTKPTQVSVIVTNACNLKCVMCPYHSPVIRPTHSTDFFKEVTTMEWSLMEKIANEVGPLQIPVKIGNIEEPLLHPRLVDFIQLCREKGSPTAHITSNGLLLTEEKARELIDAGLTSIYISIDGATQETYKRIRGANLEKVENNIKTLLRLREELNAPLTVMVSFIRNEGVTKEEEEMFVSKWRNVVDGVMIYNLADYVNGNARVAKINEATQTFMEEAGGRWTCLNPWQEIYLLPDGRVYYCCETVSKLAHENLVSMGDYNTQTIPDVWNGEVFKSLRKALLHNQLDDWSACKDCGIWMAHVSDSTETEEGRIVSSMMTEMFYSKGK